MDRSCIWIKYGSNMNQIWIKYGSNMDRSCIWIKYRSNIDQIWIKYGSNLDLDWILDVDLDLELDTEFWWIWVDKRTPLSRGMHVWSDLCTSLSHFGHPRLENTVNYWGVILQGAILAESGEGTTQYLRAGSMESWWEKRGPFDARSCQHPGWTSLDPFNPTRTLSLENC